MNPVPCPLPTIPKKDQSVDVSKFEIRQEDLEYEKSIGSGGFAEVWLGKYLPEDTKVAIKKIRTSENIKEEMKNYHLEINVLASIKHPFLLPFIGYTAEEPLCIVTKYISGGSLYSALRTDDPEKALTPTQISIIALGIAIGLQYMHGKGIIHRDLKSQNVLLDENKYPIICDFGSSRNKECTKMLTGQGGTANYMAPEFIRVEKYNEKIDVYSYGILLWEMITHESPFNGLMATQIICSVLMFNNRPEIPPDVSKPIKHLIKKCWDRNPSERPSFSEIVEFLTSHHGLVEGTDPVVFDQFVAQFRTVNQQISIGLHQSPKPKHRSIVSLNPMSYSSQHAADTNTIIDSQQILNNNFKMLTSGNQNQINEAITFISNNIDDPGIFVIPVWSRIFTLLTTCSPAILPRAKELALLLAKNREILSIIDQVKDLEKYVKAETLDVFLYAFSYFPKIISTKIISELSTLVNSPECGYQAIVLLCKAHSLTQSHEIIDQILDFFVINLCSFSALQGGNFVVKLVENYRPISITDEVFIAFVGSRILENITAAYQILFVRKLSPGLLQPNLLNLHMVLPNFEPSKEVDELIETALNFARIYAMNVTGYNLSALVKALIDCVILRKSEHACLLLCSFATDDERKHVFTQEAIIDQILGVTDENAASILMTLVLLIIKDHTIYNSSICAPLLPLYFSTVIKASSIDSFFSVCWSIEHLSESKEFFSKLFECGVVDQIINAVCSTQQACFINFVKPSLLKVMEYGYTPAFTDLSKHLIKMINDKNGIIPCLAVLAQLSKYKEQQDYLMANNIVATISTIQFEEATPYINVIFQSLRDGIL